jgi:hypothetical protein
LFLTSCLTAGSQLVRAGRLSRPSLWQHNYTAVFKRLHGVSTKFLGVFTYSGRTGSAVECSLVSKELGFKSRLTKSRRCSHQPQGLL